MTFPPARGDISRALASEEDPQMDNIDYLKYPKFIGILHVDLSPPLAFSYYKNLLHAHWKCALRAFKLR